MEATVPVEITPALLYQIVSGIMIVSAILANWVSPASKFGKILHLIGANGPHVQQAILSLSPAIPAKPTNAVAVVDGGGQTTPPAAPALTVIDGGKGDVP